MNTALLPKELTLTVLNNDILVSYRMPRPHYPRLFGRQGRGPDRLWASTKARNLRVVLLNHVKNWREFLTISPRPAIFPLKAFADLLTMHRDYIRKYVGTDTQYVWLIEFSKVSNAPHAHFLFDSPFGPALREQLKRHWLEILQLGRSNDSYYFRTLGLDSSSKFVAMYLSKLNEQKYPRKENLAKIGAGARLWGHSQGLKTPRVHAIIDASQDEMFDLFGTEWLNKYNMPYSVIHGGYHTLRARFPECFQDSP